MRYSVWATGWSNAFRRVLRRRSPAEAVTPTDGEPSSAAIGFQPAEESPEPQARCLRHYPEPAPSHPTTEYPIPTTFPIALLLAAFAANIGFSAESPTSDGPVAALKAPSLRIPMMKKVPSIDGAWSEDEWEDASGLSGFWSKEVPKVRGRYAHMAPHQIQSRIYAGYDRERLYLAYLVNTYPQKAWLKARGRFPDVYSHPLYGIMGDDHVEFELRPYHDLTQGYKWGMFKWFANPIGVISDQHWSLEAGMGKMWQSHATVRSGVTDEWWCVEMKIPLKEMKQRGYAGKDEEGRDVVRLPPPNGTVYRCWFKNGIGGYSRYVVLWDQHVWNTTKAQLILDSDSVGFQIHQLGPIMEDLIEVKISLKNHSSRSHTVRLGFFMENAYSLIYSSYEDKNTKDGLLELVPGEVKKLTLKKRFPGISPQSNFLWFDVRTAGRPAKIIYQNRLSKFYSVDPGPPYQAWREYKLEGLTKMRPPKMDFSFKYQYSPYTNKLSAIVDRGIHGASREAQRAVEAKLSLTDGTEEENLIVEKTVPFHYHFATFLMDVPELKPGRYKVWLLLFDKNKRIVGERQPEAFRKAEFPWERNTLGQEDIVWQPFEPLELKENSFETIKQIVTLAPSGLPAQISIKPDKRELPLEKREDPSQMAPDALLGIGRGPQLRAPIRLEAVVGGKRVSAEVVEPFKPVREWKSEVELLSKLKVGPLDVSLSTQYDCDAAMTAKLTYGAAAPVEVELLEMVMDVAGPVDLRVGGAYGMQPASGMLMVLPDEEGIVWDSANPDHLEPFSLYYSKFVPFFYFGSGDRGWSWLCGSDREWTLNQDGSAMTLERDAKGQVTWRIKFVNHKAVISGKRTVEFAVFTHPVKSREKDYRYTAWLDWPPGSYNGKELKCLPNDGPWGIAGSGETFKYFLKKYPNGAPRLYIFGWRNSGIPELRMRAYTGEWLFSQSMRLDSTPIDRRGGYGQPWNRPGKGCVTIMKGSRSWEDYLVYQCERMVRIGKVTGWWWDGYSPTIRTECVANGCAYFRDPKEVKKDELPWQPQFAALRMRSMYKRVAKIMKKESIPNCNSFWASAATTWESYGRDSELRESAGALSLAYEIDNVTRFPISMFRYCSNTAKGLYTRIQPEASGGKGTTLMPGDDIKMDRGILGRCLLHDIATAPQLPNAEQFARVLNTLYDFGYFEEDTTEMIPYWRSRSVCRYGEEFTDDEFEVTTEDPCGQAYVTIYRRPYKKVGKRQGYKALFVVQNESDSPVRERLHILNSEAVFGGDNSLLIDEIYCKLRVPQGTGVGGKVYGFSGSKALEDLERTGAVTQSRKAGMVVTKEIYGPLHILPHDFRLLYGHHDPDLPARASQRLEYFKQKAQRAKRELNAAAGAVRQQLGWPSGEEAKGKPWWEYRKSLPKIRKPPREAD